MNAHEVAALVPTVGPSLFRFFLARMPRALADEAVQEVFLRLLKTNSFDQQIGKIENFIWGVAANVQRELLRKQGLVLESEEMEVATNNHPEEDSFSDLRRAVGLLGEPEGRIFQMVLADLPLEQIATTLDMPLGTVKSHVHRGKESLRTTMKKWGYE